MYTYIYIYIHNIIDIHSAMHYSLVKGNQLSLGPTYSQTVWLVAGFRCCSNVALPCCWAQVDLILPIPKIWPHFCPANPCHKVFELCRGARPIKQSFKNQMKFSRQGQLLQNDILVRTDAAVAILWFFHFALSHSVQSCWRVG